MSFVFYKVSRTEIVSFTNKFVYFGAASIKTGLAVAKIA